MPFFTAYEIPVFLTLALVNFFGWRTGVSRLHDLNIFSTEFMLGALGMYVSARVNGYRKALSR